MRIGNINGGFRQNVNFTRVIPLNFTKTPNASTIRGIDPALAEISDILNSCEPFFYSKEESSKIREFFRQKIDDYNGKNGVLITKAGNKIYLVTGEDVEEVYAAKKRAQKKISGIKSTAESNKKKDNKISEVKNALFSEIEQKAENGNGRKPDSGFTLNRKDIQNLRFDSISYYYKYYSSYPEKYVHIPSGRTLNLESTAIYDTGKLEI